VPHEDGRKRLNYSKEYELSEAVLEERWDGKIPHELITHDLK
jgi:hypothetical protein